MVVALLVAVAKVSSFPKEIKQFFKYLLVCCIASLCSVLVIATSVFAAMVFIPVDPEQDHIRGALYALQLMPLYFIVLSVYFLLLGVAVSRVLKNAVVAQSLVSLVISTVVAYPAVLEAGWAAGIIVFSGAIVYLSFVFGAGSLVWVRCKII